MWGCAGQPSGWPVLCSRYFHPRTVPAPIPLPEQLVDWLKMQGICLFDHRCLEKRVSNELQRLANQEKFS